MPKVFPDPGKAYGTRPEKKFNEMIGEWRRGSSDGEDSDGVKKGSEKLPRMIVHKPEGSARKATDF